MNSPDSADGDQKQKIINLMVAGAVGQVGCLTLVIVLAAVLGGLFIDSRFQSRPLFTLLFVIASIPVSLAVMITVTRGAVRKIKTQTRAHKAQQGEEVSQIGRSDDD